MTNATDRTARRRLRIDPRLLAGVGLVAVSVVGVTALVGAADARIEVYAAAEPLRPGDLVTADDMVLRSVALDGAEAQYLTAADVPGDGLVVTRAVAAGELVPRSAAGSTGGLRATAVVLELSMPISAAVVAGSLVDVWSTTSGEQEASGPPTVVVPDATVVRVLEDEGFVAGGPGSAAVEVLVPRTRIARLLQAIADGDGLAVVPAGLPLVSP
jgi:hypothetical protein